MLGFLGDVHGDYGCVARVGRNIQATADASALIQVGDFGYYPHLLHQLIGLTFAIPTYFIRGNHDDHDTLLKLVEVTEVYPNLFYVPDGTLLELDGKKIAFLGGAASVDKALRIRKGWHWSEKENISTLPIQNLWGEEGVDILVTHCPPQWIIDKYCDPENLVEFFGLPLDWKDPNAQIVEDVWRRMGEPELFCGHLHMSRDDGQVHVLNINDYMVG